MNQKILFLFLFERLYENSINGNSWPRQQISMKLASICAHLQFVWCNHLISAIKMQLSTDTQWMKKKTVCIAIALCCGWFRTSWLFPIFVYYSMRRIPSLLWFNTANSAHCYLLENTTKNLFPLWYFSLTLIPGREKCRF